MNNRSLFLQSEFNLLQSDFFFSHLLVLGMLKKTFVHLKTGRSLREWEEGPWRLSPRTCFCPAEL